MHQEMTLQHDDAEYPTEYFFPYFKRITIRNLSLGNMVIDNTKIFT